MTLLSTVAYDANGNTLSDAQGRSFTWDFENRLVQAVVPGSNGGTTTFKYDPFELIRGQGINSDELIRGQTGHSPIPPPFQPLGDKAKCRVREIDLRSLVPARSSWRQRTQS